MMKNFFRVLLIYFLIFIIFTFFYLLLFNTSLFSFQKVLFYRGAILLMIATFVFLFLSVILNNKLKISFETLFAAILVSASINLSLFVVLPVTFERSITMYLLNSLRGNKEHNCQGIIKSNLNKKFIKEFVNNNAIDKRLDEQKVIGFIREKNQCIQLTPQALNFLKFSKIVGRLYGLK